MAETLALALWEAGFGNAAVFALSNAAVINTALLVTANYAHGQDQRRRLRNQARDAFNASLQDRQVMVRSAVAPRGRLYGRDKVAGQLADAFVTGTKGEYLHLVVAFYGHECDACETIYFNNIALPAPDGSGFIQSGEFSKTTTTATWESTASGSIVLAHTPSTITSVTKTTGTGSGESATTVTLALTTGYTVAGSTVTFVDGSGPTYTVNYEYQTVTPLVRVKVHLGASGPTADSDLVAESGGRWTSADVGEGIAYIYFRLQYDTDVFGQIGLPDIQAAWRGLKLLDPRTATTAWTDNAALATRDYLRSSEGIGSTAAEVPDSEINTAANVCDEEVTLYSTGTVAVTSGSPNVTGSGTTWTTNCYPGLLFVSTDGTRYTVRSVTDNTHLVLTANYGGSTLSGQAYSLRQKRYTVNGTIGTEEAPRENLRKLLGTMAGTAVWVQGRWLVRAGAYQTPVPTFNEDYLAQGTISIVPRASRRDQFNRVSGTYLDANALYVEKQYPAVVNTTYKAADGGLELTREISLWGVTDSFRAQRLAKIALERARQAMTVRFTTSWRGYDLVPSDTVLLTLARYGWSAKPFEIRARRMVPTDGGGMVFEYTAIETASAVWSWNLGEQTVYSAAAATNLPNPFATPATLGSLACDSGSSVNTAIAATLVPRGLVTWTASTDVFVQQGGRIEVEWKLWNDTAWQKAGPVPGDSTSTYISPLQPLGVTLIRARAVNAAGRAGLWSTITHTVASGGSLGGGNLLRNSDFEVDSNADGLADNWIGYSSGTTGTITYSLVSGGVGGGKYQQITASNLGTGSGDQAGVHEIIELEGLAGRSITWSPYVYGLGAGTGSINVRLYIDWYSAAGGTGTILSASQLLLDRPPVGWGRYSLSAVIPAGALSCRAYVWMEARGVGAGTASLIVDKAQYEVGVQTAYATRADELLAGSVTTPVLATDARGVRRSVDAASTVTVTEVTHVPDGFTFKDQLIADAQFTAAYDGKAVVTFTYALSQSGSAGTTECWIGNEDDAFSAGLFHQCGPNPSGSTYRRAASATLLFPITASDTYTFAVYASKNAGGETVSFDTMQLIVEVTYGS